ncbi:MAG: ABC transporter substrate-binding protein [Methylotenera sp.]|nr:ABC transporter substrate-binding protein [Oligoflexia bacterium]
MKTLNLRKLVSSLTLVALATGSVLIGSACTTKRADSGNTLNLVSTAKIKGIDPAHADDLYSGLEVGRVFEGLLQYSYLKRPYVLEPLLAESMPEMGADGKTYTIHLKKGVLFQDDKAFKATQGKGREMTAEDVVFTFKRLADPKLSSAGWWLIDGKIVGINEWHDAATKAGKADYAAAVEGLKVIDPHTVQIKLNQHSFQFLYTLAMPQAGIVPHEAVELYGDEFLNHPVGTGPFKLEDFNPASKISYVRNPTYRKEVFPSEGEAGDKEAGLLADAGKPLPFADRVVVQIITETQPQWLNFLQGKLDVSPIPKDNFAQAIVGQELSPELKAKNMKLHKMAQIEVTHTTFNMADPIVGKNRLLRQAISTAFDQTAYNETFYNGRAIEAQGPIPPGLAGYDPSFKNPYRQFNLAKAKELMSKAGYPEGKGLPVLEYLTLADSTSRQGTEFFERALAPLGIKLKVSTFSWPEFNAALKNKKGQMWSFAWGADYPDAENFLQLFYSKNMSPGPNDSNYSNPEFDRMYEKSLTMKDSPERTALYQSMVKVLVEDCPWIFDAHRLAFTLTQPWIKNYKPHDLDHGRSKYLRIDGSLKK